MKKRVNISIDPALHEWAQAQAEAECSYFSLPDPTYEKEPND